MTDIEPTTTNRTVILTVGVSTDQELATVHEALSRTAVGYICDDMNSEVYVESDSGEGLKIAYVGVHPSTGGDQE